ncbi:MAG: hypothetical protein ABGY96_16800 [bacterium]|nr:hypothetical protein [Gammaproteobacteria bacterium]HIL97876.1 hypothetical protein [Pseudomonadales bacterium]
MASVTYAIVFNGEIGEGFQIISVKAHMAKLLKADANKMQVLFSGKPVVIKRTPDKAVAVKWGTALKKIGASVRVKVVKADASTASATPSKKPLEQSSKAASRTSSRTSSKTKRAPTPAASNQTRAVFKTSFDDEQDDFKDPVESSAGDEFSLAPNVGNLFEQAPAVAAPNLNLSEYSVSENDDTPLVEPTVYQPAEIDLSEYSVAENNGTSLVEAAPEVARVEAPDFALDKPGAILETLKETVELLDPDTSSMSLAFPGTDLLDEDEKQGPPPKGPDVSNISLLPNFDL